MDLIQLLLGSTILASLDYNESQLNNGAYISVAHRIDCEDLEDTYIGASGDTPLTYISFKSKEIKYDKIYDKENAKYVYDHQVYTDYRCIVDSNYLVTDNSGQTFDGNTEILKYLINGGENTSNKLKAYRIGVAKERNNLYKSVAFSENYGYKILNNNSGIVINGNNVNNPVSLQSFSNNSYNPSEYPNINYIAKIELVIENTSSGIGIYTTTMQVGLNGFIWYSNSQTIPTTSTSMRTIDFTEDLIGDRLSGLLIKLNNDARTTLKSIKIYYK